MIDTSIKEIVREGVSVESNPLLGYVSTLVDENVYLIEDTVIDEGKYRTVITISLTPIKLDIHKTMLKLKGKEVKKGLRSLS